MSAPRINAERLLRDLRELARFGSTGPGVHRQAFSREDIEARTWLRDRMADAGLDAVIDGIGNVYGKNEGTKRAVLMGSHSDTVPQGGWLDGSLGIVYGIEIARVLREQGGAPTGVDVVSFADEEGTYLSWLGSRTFSGDVSQAQLEGARSTGGETLTDVLARCPFHGRATERLERDRIVAYFEPHIEQGPRLEHGDRRIGVVTGIVGIRNYWVRVAGRPDHAGTTPMSMRADAGAALIHLAHRLLEAFERTADSATVWNIGSIQFRPGGRSVVPSAAELTLQFRDERMESLRRLEAVLDAEVRRCNEDVPAVACSTALISSSDPVPMDESLQQRLAGAAHRRGASSMSLVSGAGHDAAVLGRHVPSAMMFIPSIGGRSHCPEEDTREEDIVLGANVALEMVMSLVGARPLPSDPIA